jgi:integrase
MGVIKKVDRGLYRVTNKDGTKGWMIDYIDPDKKRVRKTFNTKKEAVDERAKRVSLIAEKRYLDVKKEYTTTLKELADIYLKNCRHQSSHKDKKRYIDAFMERFGENTRLEAIQYIDLETYKNELVGKPVYKRVRKMTSKGPKVIREARQRKTSTVNIEMSAIRKMFKKGVEWGKLESSPFTRGESLFKKPNNAKTRFLDSDEIERLLAVCPPYLKDCVICAINSGMRRGELLSLKWDQVRNGFIYLTETKTDEARQIPINSDLEALFKKIRKKQHLKSSYVFLYNGKPMKDIHVGLTAALKRAGIAGVTTHTLRHTFASHFVMRGGSLKDLQELLGHRNITMTMRYAHLSQEHKMKAVHLLNGLTSGNENKSMSVNVSWRVHEKTT